MIKNESDFDPEIESFSKDTKIDLDNKIRELHDLGVRLKKNFEEYQSNEFDLDPIIAGLSEDAKKYLYNQRKEQDDLTERAKQFKKKYRTDNQIEKIGEKWNLEWIPMIPEIIDELKSNDNDNDNDNDKGNRFHKYFLFAIILEFNLSDTDCQLTDEEFSEIIQVKDINIIKNHLNELMTLGYIAQHDLFGTYNSFHLHSAINKIDELMVSDSKLRKFVNKLLKSDIESLKSDIKLLKSKNELLKSDIESLKSDIESLKSDSELLKSKSELLKFVNKLLKSNRKIFKSDSELYTEHTIEKIQKIIDEYKYNIGNDRNFKRTLICNFDKISDKNVINIPFDAGLLEDMDTYSFLLLATICNKTIIDKKAKLKYTNVQYSEMIGCSVREIELSIKDLIENEFIEAVYIGKSNKHRDYIKLKNEI